MYRIDSVYAGGGGGEGRTAINGGVGARRFARKHESNRCRIHRRAQRSRIESTVSTLAVEGEMAER